MRISISGLIGAGKTTLVKALANGLHYDMSIEEIAELPMLEAFYSDMKKYAYDFQLAILDYRYNINKDRHNCIMDKSIFDDFVFAKLMNKLGYISNDELLEYINIFNEYAMSTSLDKVIFINAGPELSLSQIKKRNRDIECNISLEYMCDLYECYKTEYFSVLTKYDIPYEIIEPVKMIDGYIRAMDIFNIYKLCNVKDYFSVAICGPIGAGKTTLIKNLSRRSNNKVFLEPVINNPYLDDFYKDPKSVAYDMQNYLLDYRVEQQKDVNSYSGFCIQDRFILDDMVFASVSNDNEILTDDEFERYKLTYKSKTDNLVMPDLVIFIDISPERSLDNILSRGRECEKNIPIEYLVDLYNKYIELLPTNSIVLKSDDFISTEYIADLLGLELTGEDNYDHNDTE